VKRFSTSTSPLAQHDCIRIIAISFAVVYRFLATVFDPRDCPTVDVGRHGFSAYLAAREAIRMATTWALDC